MELGEPNPKQKAFFAAKEKYVAYGGARGGGKSWAVRMKAIDSALRYPGLRELIVRRTYPELEHSIIWPTLATLRSQEPPLGIYRAMKRTVEFENGSTIRFGHLAAGNLGEYLGQEYDRIFLDEATQFTEREFRMMAATLRGTLKVPRRMYLTCNPGGVGHQWVKRLFVDRRFKGREKPEEYRFIPATVEDNKALLAASPEYLETLELLPEDIRRGHRYGDWGVFAGQYFSEFDPRLHVGKLGPPKPEWTLYRGIDYGLDMLACVWFGMDSGGRMYVYREVQEPGLVIDESCRGLIENLQALRYSERNPSDCDVKPHAITHICDALRYGCQLPLGGGSAEPEDGGALGYIYYGM